jgi:hypothetical protein
VDDDPEKPFSLLVQREKVPDYINDVTWLLHKPAGAHGGHYDRWGA